MLGIYEPGEKYETNKNELTYYDFKDNAKQFGVSMENELLRVIIHGILHLCGYKDKTKKEAAVMRSKEESCLQKYYNNNL